MALLQELRMAIGFKKQSALQTALLAASTWSLRQTSREIGQPIANNESDRDDIGKGVYATQLFKSHRDAPWNWNGFLTSENAAMVVAFGLGKAVKTLGTPVTAFVYTCTPMNPVTDGDEMPVTTVVQAIRQGGSDVFDFALIGLACEEFSISLNSGPGRNNSTMTSSWVGCGKYANPSTITIPTITTEHGLNAGSASAITIVGENYLTNKRFVNCEIGWKNNIRLDSGFFPGGGTQDGYNLRGRLRRGTPEPRLRFTVEFVDGSTELASQLALTEGTAVITVPGATIGAGPDTHKLQITFHRVVFRSVPIGEVDGIVTVGVECEVLEHSSNGVVTIVVTNEQDNILVTA